MDDPITKTKMNDRINYKLSESDLEDLLKACAPSSSPQERANAAWEKAWEKLGKKLGFDHMTVIPTGTSNSEFTAKTTNQN